MKSRKNRWIITGALLLLSLGIAAHLLGCVKPINPALLLRFEPGSYAIRTFVDGDTIMVDMNGKTETIRFIGVDTPETHKPNTPVQCYGPEASEYTKNRIGTTRVRLVSDSLTTNRDRYDRLLRYVVLEDGTYLNLELIENGYGFAYDFPFAKSQLYHDAQAAAQKAKSGLWGKCNSSQNPTTGQWHSNDISDQNN